MRYRVDCPPVVAVKNLMAVLGYILLLLVILKNTLINYIDSLGFQTFFGPIDFYLNTPKSISCQRILLIETSSNRSPIKLLRSYLNKLGIKGILANMT